MDYEIIAGFPVVVHRNSNGDLTVSVDLSEVPVAIFDDAEVVSFDGAPTIDPDTGQYLTEDPEQMLVDVRDDWETYVTPRLGNEPDQSNGWVTIRIPLTPAPPAHS